MATIVSSRSILPGRVPGSTRLARWLDERAPLLLLAAVLAILVAAGREAHVGEAPARPAAPAMAAE